MNASVLSKDQESLEQRCTRDVLLKRSGAYSNSNTVTCSHCVVTTYVINQFYSPSIAKAMFIILHRKVPIGQRGRLWETLHPALI